MSDHVEPHQRRPTEHEASYFRDVLILSGHDTEEQLDDRIEVEAKELGIDVATERKQRFRTQQEQQEQAPMSSNSASSGSASAIELHRRSNFPISRSSPSQRAASEPSKPYQATDRVSKRASLSIRDYDAFVSRRTSSVDDKRPASFSRPSTTTTSSGQSIPNFSLPLTPPEEGPPPIIKRSFGMIRSLSILRPRRSSSTASLPASPVEGCPHCAQDAMSQRRAIHRLPCGHRLCTQALRNIIKAATDSKTAETPKAACAAPSCCGQPIPGRLVEHVMTQQEQTALFTRLEQWSTQPLPSASAPSLLPAEESRERQPSSGTLSPHQEEMPFSMESSRAASPASKVDSVQAPAGTHGRHASNTSDIDQKYKDRKEYKRLRKEQASTRDRFRAWMHAQRVKLEAEHEIRRMQLKTKQEKAIDDMCEQHGADMAEAEDKQVKAEADMRVLHAQEEQDNATALKYMEAYCAGKSTSGEAHERTVTDQDRQELYKTRQTRDGMERKHGNSINVLRGEQQRRIRSRQQRQDKEVQQVKRAQRLEEIELERTCSKELSNLENYVRDKREQLKFRWELQRRVLAKKYERETRSRRTSRAEEGVGGGSSRRTSESDSGPPSRVDSRRGSEEEHKAKLDRAFAKKQSVERLQAAALSAVGNELEIIKSGIATSFAVREADLEVLVK